MRLSRLFVASTRRGRNRHHGSDGRSGSFRGRDYLSGNEVPSVSGRLLADEAAIEKLEIPALNKGRIPEYLKANMLTARNVTDRPVLPVASVLIRWPDVCMICRKS